MRPENTLWWATKGLLLLALVGAGWAFVASGSCGSCGGDGAVYKKTLAAAGIAYYAILLATAIAFGPKPIIHGGILLAGGTHGVLLAALYTKGIFCPPCVLTGTVALAATITACVFDPQNLIRATWIVPGTAVVWNTLLISVLGVNPPMGKADIEALIPPQAKEERAPASPSVRMVIYSDPGCFYCQKLKQDVMPDLEREFGSRLAVTWRSASDHPGMPTPTIVLLGIGGRRLFPGLPPKETLRNTILEIEGDRHEPHAMLPTSR